MAPLIGDAAAERIRSRHAGQRVLLAEDDEIGQIVMFEWLSDLGLQADMAADGYEAVDLATRTSYALALLDFHMPGLDGLATARALRRLTGHGRTPLVMLTARPLSADDRQVCREAGIDDFLAKPVDGPRLAACLLDWLERQPPAAAPGAPARPAPAAAATVPQGLQPLLGLDGLDPVAGLAAVGGRPEVYRRLLRVFGETHGGDGQALQDLLQRGEHAAAGQLAHRLRGAAATLGLVDIEATVSALETALNQPGAAAAALQSLLDALRQALDRGLQRLDALRPFLDSP